MPQTPHWLQWGHPTFDPKITRSCGPIPKPNSVDPSDLPSQTASISDQLFCHNALGRQTDTHTDQQMIGGNVRCSMMVLLYRQHCSLIILHSVPCTEYIQWPKTKQTSTLWHTSHSTMSVYSLHSSKILTAQETSLSASCGVSQKSQHSTTTI